MIYISLRTNIDAVRNSMSVGGRSSCEQISMFGAKTERKPVSEHKFLVFILDSRILAFSLAWDVKLPIR